MRLLLLPIVFALFIHLNTTGQVLSPIHFIDDNYPRFNPAWVKQHGIKEMHGSVAFKRDDAPIRRTNETYSYTFDESGRTIKETHIYGLLNRTDTSEVHYRYDAMGRLIKRIEKDAYGFFALNFFYNEKDELLRRYYSREVKSTPLLDVFEREKIIWEDSISHFSTSDSVRQQWVFNSIGKAYQRVNSYWNAKGHLSRKVETNLIGGHYTTVELTYSDNGKLLTLSRYSTLRPEFRFMQHFQYSASAGKLEFIRIEENEALLSNRRLTYTAEGLIEFELTRNIVTRNMEIVSYDYRFFH